MRRISEDDSEAPKGIGLAGCAMLLGQPQPLLWVRWKAGEFALPAGTKNNQPFWYEGDVYRWAASTRSRLTRRVPLRFWPDAERTAAYRGMQRIEDAAVQTWETDVGTVCVLWPLPPGPFGGLPLHRVADQLPFADALVCVRAGFVAYGPQLWTGQPGNLTEWNGIGAQWPDLARVLGQPAPYWPYMLRIPALIDAWKPGTPPVTYPTIPEVDTTPLLRLAANLPRDRPAHEMLLHLARTTQLRSTNFARDELQKLAECDQRGIDRGQHHGNVTVIAARPLLPDLDEETLDLQRRRAGWLEILARTDQLAVECVSQADMWDGGADFPFSNPEQIDPTTEYGAEWSARLKPIERTAAFELIDFDGHCETLIDPKTEAPVVRQANGLLSAAIPQTLGTYSPLAEVILDSPIWVRTQDGTLYPAPKDSYFGLSWGYSGSGPGSLALLISRLLDDINARGADSTEGAPDGLDKLTQIDWPAGTVLTRAQLEAARDGLPYAEE